MLVKEQLTHNIRCLTDQGYANFKGFPKTYMEATANWSEAFYDYYRQVSPISISAESAKATFSTLMMANVGVLKLEMIYKAAIIQLALGTTGWLSVVNPSKLDLSDIYDSGSKGAGASDIANNISKRIHDWTIGCTAIKIISPFNVINWK